MQIDYKRQLKSLRKFSPLPLMFVMSPFLAFELVLFADQMIPFRSIISEKERRRFVKMFNNNRN